MQTFSYSVSSQARSFANVFLNLWWHPPRRFWSASTTFFIRTSHSDFRRFEPGTPSTSSSTIRTRLCEECSWRRCPRTSASVTYFMSELSAPEVHRKATHANLFLQFCLRSAHVSVSSNWKWRVHAGQKSSALPFTKEKSTGEVRAVLLATSVRIQNELWSWRSVIFRAHPYGQHTSVVFSGTRCMLLFLALYTWLLMFTFIPVCWSSLAVGCMVCTFHRPSVGISPEGCLKLAPIGGAGCGGASSSEVTASSWQRRIPSTSSSVYQPCSTAGWSELEAGLCVASAVIELWASEEWRAGCWALLSVHLSDLVASNTGEAEVSRISWSFWTSEEWRASCSALLSAHQSDSLSSGTGETEGSRISCAQVSAWQKFLHPSESWVFAFCLQSSRSWAGCWALSEQFFIAPRDHSTIVPEPPSTDITVTSHQSRQGVQNAFFFLRQVFVYHL